jgi:rhamnosyl/mannosyltransferase
MRVLHLGKYYDPYMGGIETHLSMLCTGLLESHEVEVLVCNTDRRTVHETVGGVKVTRAGAWARAFSTHLTPALVTELSSRSYDVLHLHTPNPMGMLAYVVARKPRDHHLVVTHHSDVVRQVRMRRWLEPLFSRVMFRADVILATSPSYAATSRELAPHRERVRVIPYGIDLDPYVSPDHASAARELRARFGQRVVLGVGRLIYYKGFEVLLDAIAHIDAHLVIVGDGPLRHFLEKRAAELRIAQRVTFAGEVHQKAMPAWYRAADVFAFPSVARSEAFGIVQLEAMASGIAVVNTSLDSGVPYVSLDGETGLTVPPLNPNALAEALERLLSDAALRARLGAAGRERVAAMFSNQRMLRAHEELYQELVRVRSRFRANAA